MKPLRAALCMLLLGACSTTGGPTPGYGVAVAAGGPATLERDSDPGVACRIANGSGLAIEWRGGSPVFRVAEAAPGTDIFVSAAGTEYVEPADEGIVVTGLMGRQMFLERPIVFKFTGRDGRRQSRSTVLAGAAGLWRQCAGYPIH